MCKEQAFNASIAEIDTYVAQRKADYGSFDQIHQSDQNYCNVNNYSRVEYRVKANPYYNWVTPVITNYEYKVHFGQGIDFNSLVGAYSNGVLLQGETKAVIVHFNHTQRAEAFYFDYRNANNQRQTSPILNSPLSLADTIQTSGSLYMNNVTRHSAIKFDGQAAETLSFSFIRDPCITVGG